MSRKWLWLTIGAVAVVGFVAGMVVAQEGDFDFLPAYYAESHTPTLVAWREVQFNAFEDRELYLTDRLAQTSCALFVEDWGIDLEVGTSTEPDWDMYLGDGYFALFVEDWGIDLEVGTSTEPDWDMYLGDGYFACSDEEVTTTYAEAAEEIADVVRDYFPELADEDLYIEFYIEDAIVAAWEDGETFVGDELDALWWF